MALNAQQRAQLLRPLNSGRIARRKQGNSGPALSYLEAWDVKAHLTRIFGFGGWSSEVIESSLVFEEKGDRNWDVSWKVALRLTVHGIRPDDGDATYTEAAVGSAHLPQRGEAHDMAIKTAESDALKRCAINLGTQFGLSLYDNGATRDVVGRTLDVEAAEGGDTQRAITPTEDPEMVTVTNTDGEAEEAPPAASQAVQPPADTEGAAEWVARLADAVKAGDVAAVVTIKADARKAKALSLTYQGQTVSKWCDKAAVEAGKVKTANPVTPDE